MSKLTEDQITGYLPHWTDECVKDMILSDIRYIRDYDDVNLLFDTYSSNALSLGQMQEVRKGLIDGLSVKQIRKYATPKLSKGAMAFIRSGLSYGYNDEKICLINNPSLNYSQIAVIDYAIRHNLPLDKIREYAKPEINEKDMADMFTSMMRELKS